MIRKLTKALTESQRKPPCTNISIYDTGFLVGLKRLNSNRLLSYIQSQQNTDTGIWGYPDYSPQSAIVDTLSAAAAFLRHGREVPNQDKMLVSLGNLMAQTGNLAQLDTAGFELISTLLIKQLARQGLHIPLNTKGAKRLQHYKQLADKRLEYVLMARVPIEQLIFNKENRISFSAEIINYLPPEFKINIDTKLVRQCLLPNGSIALSPAATAAAIRELETGGYPVPRIMYTFIKDQLQKFGGNGVPNFSDASNLQIIWNYLPLILSGHFNRLASTSPNFRKLVSSQISQIKKNHKGLIAWDHMLDFPDLDDTVCEILLQDSLNPLTETQLEKELSKLDHFMDQQGNLVTFPGETTSSKSAALHTLLMLEQVSTNHPHNKKLIVLTEKLLHQLKPGNDIKSYLIDKWHASPAYNFQRIMSSKLFRQQFPDFIDSAIEWIAHSQMPDGGWGLGSTAKTSTIEETGLVLLGFAQQPKRLASSGRKRAKQYITQNHRKKEAHKPLWMAKNLHSTTWGEFCAVLPLLVL